MKKLLLGLLILVLVSATILVVFAKKRPTIANGGRTYRIDMPEAKIETRNGVQAYVGPDKIVASAGLATYASDCVAKGGLKDFNVLIEGNLYPVCRPRPSYSIANLYLVTFKHDGVWHYGTVFSSDGSPVDSNIASNILTTVIVVR